MAKTGEISFGYMESISDVAHALHNNLNISTALKLTENILAFASAIRILSLHVLVVVVLAEDIYPPQAQFFSIIYAS